MRTPYFLLAPMGLLLVACPQVETERLPGADAGILVDAATDSGVRLDAGVDGGVRPDSGPSDGGGLVPPEAATFCDAVVEPFCRAMFACCTDPQQLDQFGGSYEGCVDALSDCESSFLGAADSLAAGETVLDMTRLEACVAELEAAGNGTCIRPPMSIAVLCVGAFMGTIPAGAPCTPLPDDLDSAPCADGLCLGGTCQPFLQPGARCDPGELGRDPDVFCNLFEGQWCYDDGQSPPTCQDFQPVGAPCVPHDSFQYQCESLVCEMGQCQAATGEQLCQEGG